jgi:hypothetical protein
VADAARAVGMSEQSAYQFRRLPAPTASARHRMPRSVPGLPGYGQWVGKEATSRMQGIQDIAAAYLAARLHDDALADEEGRARSKPRRLKDHHPYPRLEEG